MTSESSKPIKSSNVLNLGIIVIGLVAIVILLVSQAFGDDPAAVAVNRERLCAATGGGWPG